MTIVNLPILRLQIVGRIPVGVKDDDTIGAYNV